MNIAERFRMENAKNRMSREAIAILENSINYFENVLDSGYGGAFLKYEINIISDLDKSDVEDLLVCFSLLGFGFVKEDNIITLLIYKS